MASDQVEEAGLDPSPPLRPGGSNRLRTRSVMATAIDPVGQGLYPVGGHSRDFRVVEGHLGAWVLLLGL